MSKKDVSQSKFLSLVLRHEPGKIGATLDANGWTEVDLLLAALARHGRQMSRDDLERVVHENDKKRFTFSEDGQRIRANQGHSVEVDLALAPQTPPELLYHGTVERFWDSILATGLRKGGRHHVHLSADRTTAEKVGQRRGKPIILEVRSGDMHRAGHPFFLSDNGVWLADHVPVEFVVRQEADSGAALSGQNANTTLFRPTGLDELKLVHDSGMKAWPPRLPGQPIFYPVMNREYAQQIARDWNAKSEPAQIGFVLSFDVETKYLSRFPAQTVGAKQHEELWVPAEELDEFNRHIMGEIRILDVFRGPECTIEVDDGLLLPKALIAPPEGNVLFEGRFLRVKKKGHWEYVERSKATGIVAILAITDLEEIVLVEQFRVPMGQRVIEIPAGLAGDIKDQEDEALAIAAKRELLEETGFEADRMEYLTEGPPSAGLSTEVVTFFQAHGLRRISPAGGDGTEDIQVHLIPVDALEAWIETKRMQGCLVDYKVYAALYFYLRNRMS